MILSIGLFGVRYTWWCRESWCSARSEASWPGVLEPGTGLISYAASILSASSRPDSIIFLASASSRAQSTVPSTPRVWPSSSSSPVFASEKHLDSCHISSRSHMTAPASRTGDAVERNACTTLDLRLISRLVRSLTLLVRRRFQCDGG